jgi:hypothetical protein
LECGSLLPLFPHGGTSLLAAIVPQTKIVASKLAADKAAASCRTPKNSNRLVPERRSVYA